MSTVTLQAGSSGGVIGALRDALDMLGKASPHLAWCVAGLHVSDPDRGLRCTGPGGSLDVIMCHDCAPRVTEVVAWWIENTPWTRATGLNLASVSR